MTLNPALKFHFLIWSNCNIYSSKPSSMPLSKLIWCPWTLEDKKILDDRETLKFREQKQYFGIWILSQQRCYLKRNKTAILTQLPAKNPYPIILTASPQKQTVPGVHQQGWWHSSLGAQIKPSKLFKCSGEAYGLTVSGLNWLSHFSNQHFTCPVKTEIHSIVPFYTLVLHVVYRANPAIKKEAFGLPWWRSGWGSACQRREQDCAPDSQRFHVHAGEGGCSSASP